MDPHRNIFYYYSGGKKQEDQIIYDQQLENNTTKTFVNVLENVDSKVTEDFLSYVLGGKCPKGGAIYLRFTKAAFRYLR